MAKADSAAPIRVIEETPAYWRVVFDYPPFNILDATIFGALQEGDFAPTTVTEAAARDLIKQGGDTLAAWDALLKNDLPQMQNIFKQNNLPELKLVAFDLKHRYPVDKDEDDDDPRTEP